MAFYGDNPFQGDPVFNYQDSVDWKSAEAIRKAMLAGFEQAGSLSAFDVDACVWAWACAEMLALALGRPSSPPRPMPFAAATRIPDPETGFRRSADAECGRRACPRPRGCRLSGFSSCS